MISAEREAGDYRFALMERKTVKIRKLRAVIRLQAG